MAKRPTPKKRRSKRATRTQHGIYVWQELQRLRALQNSPYARPAPPRRGKEKKALKGLTRIKA